MNVYFLRAAANENRGVIVTAGELFEFSRRFNGFPMKRPWTDVTIGWDPDMLRLPKGDFPSLITNVPVFSGRTARVLADLLEDNGEMLPVIISGEEYFLFNVTRVIDALDESRSDIVRFEGKSKILDIEGHWFIEERLGKAIIFKIPQMITSDVFVTEPFVQRVRSTGLKGFRFPLLWSVASSS